MPWKNMIRVMQNIEFTTSPDSTTISPEKLGSAIGKIAHEFPTIS